MDVADSRFGAQARDRDELALQVQNVFHRFLEECLDHEGEQAKYSQDALLLLTQDRNTLFVDFKDIEVYDSTLSSDIIHEYYRFYPYLCRAVSAYVREERIRQADAAVDDDAQVAERNITREQVKRELDKPQVVNKNYYVGFYNYSNRENIRDLSSQRIGSLTRVSGQVVRTHSVHPELIVACFRCDSCLSEQYTEQQFRYTQPNICSNEQCSNRVKFSLVLERSRFTDFQRLRIQETQRELPRGAIPRCFDIIIRGADQVECIQPGDQCDFIGALIAVPDVGRMMAGTFGTVTSEMSQESAGVVGFKSLGVKEMVHSLAFLANACILEGKQRPIVSTELNEGVTARLSLGDFSETEIMKIQKMSSNPNLLDHLSQSLFSSVYGSDDIKRGIMLLLLGGVAKTTSTGTNLRGDINICLVGDPSTAKSQFLKIVADFAPVKAVYASGKASSATGLTASCVRDTDGGFVIEAGALMLADKGICCIDEFDKMDLQDQVAIHEAMEQQTITITKAGITATLNARASILAAANPIGGSYDVTRSLRANLNLSLPIMSRFDLFFVLLDPQETSNDEAIAKLIIEMHDKYANSTNPKLNMIYSFEEIKLYLRFARKYYPKLPPSAESVVVEEYLRLRANSTTSSSTRVTVRQLESLIRLSEAIARAHCSEIVEPRFIREASRLIETTQICVGKPEIELTAEPVKESVSQPMTQEPYEGEVDSQPLEASQPVTQKTKLALSIYKETALLLLAHLKGSSESIGIRKFDLIDWYLERCVKSDEINTETEFVKKKQLIELILKRMIETDGVIIAMKDDGKIVELSEESNPIIIQNPAYDEDFLEPATC